MDKTINQIDESTIYQKIYERLLEKKLDRIRYSDFYDMVADMHLTSNGLAESLEQELLNMGMLEKQILEITRKIRYPRFTLYDIGTIEKRMKEKGMIRYQHPGWLIILKN
jgi:uridine kinase